MVASNDIAGAGASDAADRMGMRIEQVLVGPPHEGDAGEGIVLRTTRGDIAGIQHAAADTDSGRAVVWVCGARGGFGGPASGLYAELAQEMAGGGITSLRLDYRQPNNLSECALDLLAGVNYLRALGYGLRHRRHHIARHWQEAG